MHLSGSIRGEKDITLFALNQLKSNSAAAKSLQLRPTLWDPRDGSPPGSASLRFCRQEHWSGLPFPSPMYESENWKWSRSVASDSWWPHGLQPTRLLHPWVFPGKSTGVGCHWSLIQFINREQQTSFKWELLYLRAWTIFPFVQVYFWVFQ